MRIRIGGLILLMFLAGGWTRTASGQHILNRYLTARFLAEARSVLEVYGPRVEELPPMWLRTTVDSLRAPAPSNTAAAEEDFVIAERRVVQRLERPLFREKFEDTEWSFLGSTARLTPLDTTFTRELRARLEAQFGPPTLTLADVKLDGSNDDYVQFEYWFVVNDTIPAIVMDVHGPYDRGLIVATDRRLRSDLHAFRKALLGPVLHTEKRKPYVDYFYDTEVDTWYRTGYNGASFFLEPIRRSRIVPGRRPWLEKPVQASQSNHASSSEPDSR